MTQNELNTIFSITISIHENKFFGNDSRIDREIVQEWVAKQIAISLEIFTIPIGSSWGVITTEDKYKEYWSKNSKLK